MCSMYNLESLYENDHFISTDEAGCFFKEDSGHKAIIPLDATMSYTLVLLRKSNYKV